MVPLSLHSSSSSSKRAATKRAGRQVSKQSEKGIPKDIHELYRWTRQVKDGDHLLLRGDGSGQRYVSSAPQGAPEGERGKGVGSSADRLEAKRLKAERLNATWRLNFQELVLTLARPHATPVGPAIDRANKAPPAPEERKMREAADKLIDMCLSSPVGVPEMTPDLRVAMRNLSKAIKARDQVADSVLQQLLDETDECSSGGVSRSSSSSPRQRLESSLSEEEPLVPLDETPEPSRYQRLMERARAHRGRRAERMEPVKESHAQVFMQKLVAGFLAELPGHPEDEALFLDYCYSRLAGQGYDRGHVLSMLRMHLFDTSLLRRLPRASVKYLLGEVARLEEMPWEWMPDLAEERATLLGRMGKGVGPALGPTPANLIHLGTSAVGVTPWLPPVITIERVEYWRKCIQGQWSVVPDGGLLLRHLEDENGKPISLNAVSYLLSDTYFLNSLSRPAALALIDAYCRAQAAQRMGD